MLATIIIVGLALYWLGIETDWLRICLEAYETIDQYDKRILDAILNETPKEDDGYQKWLAKLYEPKLKYGLGGDAEVVDARYQYMVVEDDRRARRNGEMVYQHHNAKGYNQLTRRQKELMGI